MPTVDRGGTRAGVSVVLPTINVDRWLDDAVASLLASDDVDVEVIVVHDGVTPDLSRSWMSDSRVVPVHLPVRSGVSTASNRGIEEANYDLVARLDADDLAAPQRLHRQASFLRENADVVLVGALASRIDSDSELRGTLSLPTGDDVRKNLLLQNVLVHSTCMFRLEAIRKVGGYDPSLAQMEDYDMVLRIALLGRIAVVDEILGSYRVHSGQTSRGARPSGAHIRRVAQGRRALGAALGVSRARVEALNGIWRVVQYLRYYRILRPGYER